MTTEKGMVKREEETLPKTFDEISGLADAFVKSGYFSDTKQKAQAIVKIVAGSELGLPPVYSMQNINLIRDRLTCSANTMAMMVKKSGRYNYRITEHTDDACSIDFYEIDDGKWVLVGSSKFTMDDAKRAELVKPGGGWVKYPRAMLFSRAISQGARIYAPDAIGGVYTDEEIRSIPARPNDSVKITEEEATPNPTEGESSLDQQPEATESKSSPVKDKTSTVAPKIKPIGTRDATLLKTLGEMQRACFVDYGLQPAEVLGILGAAKVADITISPAECYLFVKADQEKEPETVQF